MPRHLSYLILAALASCPAVLRAQGENKFFPPEIRKISVGFQSHQENEPSAYKVGLWTPVHVEVFGGSDGIEPKPDKPAPSLVLETVDSEGVGTRIMVPVSVDPLQSRTFTGYVKTGHLGQTNDINIVLSVHGRQYKPRNVDLYRSINIDEHLYVTLGSKMTELHRAVAKMGVRGDLDPNDLRAIFSTRHVGFEMEVDRLPAYWFGYNSADLVILSTDNSNFLKNLKNHPDQLKALAQWVRRGGRLVVPVSWKTQDVLAALLNEPLAWQPPIPVVPPRDAAGAQVLRLSKVEDWAGVRGDPFQRMDDPKNLQKRTPIPVARLDPGKVPAGDWEVLADSRLDDRRDERPLVLIGHVRYGLGQITYLAFSLDDASFLSWSGKEQFLQKMVMNLAPKAPAEIQKNEMVGRSSVAADLTTDLLAQLDSFDVTVIPFGYVALFIILYILVVGPLDFFLLKYVFKRLEWTWITFPSVVLLVSVMAYYAAYALKGNDLKINKVDIVDFDLRTDLDLQRAPRSVHAYGQSFFTILSPRIQNYTIGLEPNPKFWGEQADKVLSVDLLSWMGRPSGGFNDMSRSGSSGFFRNPYQFREDASALEGVPIPVWTTKAFSASWEQTLPKTPFLVDLVYHKKDVQGKELKISGKLENHLGVDLVDTWLIYDDRCYPIKEGLPAAGVGKPSMPISIASMTFTDMQKWVDFNSNEDVESEVRPWSANPSPLIRKLLFRERLDTTNAVRNHLLRPLDLGWRIQEERRDNRTREAILYARVRFTSGPAETLTQDQILPTNLWLGEIPEPGKTRPRLIGQLNQDTFVRVLLPVRPAPE